MYRNHEKAVSHTKSCSPVTKTSKRSFLLFSWCRRQPRSFSKELNLLLSILVPVRFMSIVFKSHHQPQTRWLWCKNKSRSSISSFKYIYNSNEIVTTITDHWKKWMKITIAVIGRAQTPSLSHEVNGGAQAPAKWDKESYKTRPLKWCESDTI